MSDVLTYVLGRYGVNVWRAGVDGATYLVRTFNVHIWSAIEDITQSFVGF